MPRIAFVAALEREVRPLVQGWQKFDREHAGRSFRFFQNGESVAVCGGIGVEAARRAAEAVIVLYTPAQIYSVGFAGALGNLKVGDVVVPRRVINATDGSSTDTGQGQGVLVSFGSVASPEQKTKLAAAYRADLVDMEAAAVAKAAEARGVVFAAMKAISDESDFTVPAMDLFIDGEGRFRAGKFGLFVALRPWLWSATLRLARNSRRAARSLCAALDGISKSPLAVSGDLRSSV